jgi:hypothetical protein
MTSPAERFFLAPELAENVLLLLPQGDILVQQHVARSWKTSIESSLPLQRKLFLEPADHGIVWEGYSPFRKSTGSPYGRMGSQRY